MCRWLAESLAEKKEGFKTRLLDIRSWSWTPAVACMTNSKNLLQFASTTTTYQRKHATTSLLCLKTVITVVVIVIINSSGGAADTCL